MKRFLKYFLVLIAGFALGIVTLIIIFAVAISSFSLNNKDVTNIEENSILTLTLPTELKDQGEGNPFSELFGNSDDESSLGLNQIKEAFSRASKDSKIKGIVLMPGLYSSGLANADEIRSYIAEFKKTQKFQIH